MREVLHYGAVYLIQVLLKETAQVFNSSLYR